MESAASLWPWERTIPGECWGWSLGEGVSLEQSAVLHMLLCPGPILHPVTCQGRGVGLTTEVPL